MGRQKVPKSDFQSHFSMSKIIRTFLGSIGHKFITDIGRTIAEITKNPKSTSFIFQAISMAVQRGNVQCVQGAYGESAFEELDEIFYILQPNCIF